MASNQSKLLTNRPKGRLWVALGLAVACSASVGWAASTVLIPERNVLSDSAATYATVAEGEIESSLKLSASAAWVLEPVASNLATGIVTSVGVMPGQEVVQGTVLYTVDLRPVVVARGAVPMFRPIGLGTKGEDAKQIQQLLTDTGDYNGAADGEAGSATLKAIEAWQKSAGMDVTGVIEVGDIVFVPETPTRISLNSEVIVRGSAVIGGEQAINSLPNEPVFVLKASQNQANALGIGVRVEISPPDREGVWEALILNRQENSETGNIDFSLGPVSGGSICAEKCVDLPVGVDTVLTTRAITAESIAGPVVPTASLLSLADGTVLVIDKKGTRHEVKVLGSAKGMSVVEGIDIGASVRVPVSRKSESSD